MPLDTAERAALPRSHGHLDHILLEPENIEIEGWMLDPERPFEAVERRGLYPECGGKARLFSVSGPGGAVRIQSR